MKPFPIAILILTTLPSITFGQAPTAVQLSHLRLHDGFTLAYQVTVRDVRTPALRQKDVADQQAGIAKALAEGHLPKNMESYYEKQARDLGQARPDEHFTITLSAREGKLLYLSTRGATPQNGGVKIAIVLNGDREYEADGATAGIINNDGWRNAPVYADENVDRLAFCPLPGVALPDVDLIQLPQPPRKMLNGHLLYKGLVPRLNVIDGESPYKAGSIEAVLESGRLKVLGLTVGMTAVPQQVWQITGSQLFQEHWLGAQMRWTEYEASLAEDGKPLASDLPTAVADYQLAEARTSALAASAFDTGSYLSDKANVADNSAGSTVFFAYDKQKGTLKEQAEAARQSAAQKELKKDSKSY